MSDESRFLDEVFEHILTISKGQCEITDDNLLSLENDPKQLNILAGLKLLHEDMELYKKDYKTKLEADYKLKVLQKKNEDLESFNYMASHDLKEPLRNIINYSQLLSRNYESHSQVQKAKYLDFINEASVRMLDLLDGLLLFSTASSALVRTPVDVSLLMNDLLKDLQITLDKANPDIIIDEDLPVISADKPALLVIFQNLLTNAIKYRDHSRQLVIRIRHESRKAENIFCVSDNGIGIEKKYYDDVFKLLKRLHTKNDIEGSGIGLSTCKKLVELHQGRMWLESVLGKGSDFYFSIPKT